MSERYWANVMHDLIHMSGIIIGLGVGLYLGCFGIVCNDLIFCCCVYLLSVCAVFFFDCPETFYFGFTLPSVFLFHIPCIPVILVCMVVIIK